MERISSCLKAACVAAALTVSVGASAATIPFNESFDGYAGAGDGASGQSDLSWAGSGAWTVASGTADLIASGDYDISCHNGSGKCIDLDGSTNNSGVLSASTFSLVAGQTYLLSAWLSGNQRSTLSTDDVRFGFRWGTFESSDTISGIASDDAFNLFTFSFVAPGNISARIFFNNDDGDGDNIGPILDDVSLTAVPLPAAGWLMLSGLLGLGAVARRRVASGAGAAATA